MIVDLADLAIKSTWILAGALCIDAWMARRSVVASRRHAFLCIAAGCVLLLPFAGRVLPETTVEFTPAVAGSPSASAEHPAPAVGSAGRGLADGVDLATIAPAGPWDGGGVNVWMITWEIGVLLLGLWIGVQFVVSRIVVASAARVVDPGLDAEFRDLRSRAGVSDAVLRVSKRLDGPACVGWLRPVILVPQAFAIWPRSRQAIALRHELAHGRRRDEVWNLLVLLMRTVCWFHPLAWVLASRSALTREMACDDAVVREGCDAVDYARLLVDVAHGTRPSKMAALGIRGPVSHLRARLRSILSDGPRPTTPLSTSLGLSLSFAVLSVVSSTVAVRPDAELLLDACASPEADVRRSALLQLSEHPESRFFSRLLPLVRDPDERVRIAAIWAVSRIGCNPAFLTVTAMLGDPSANVRGVAVRSLARFRSDLFDRRESWLFAKLPHKYRVLLNRWIGSPGSTTARELLERAVEQDVRYVRRGVDEMLAAYPPKS